MSFSLKLTDRKRIARVKSHQDDADELLSVIQFAGVRARCIHEQVNTSILRSFLGAALDQQRSEQAG
jgi:hypothetical protein